MEGYKNIVFNEGKYKRLKKRYEQAVEQKENQFTFEGDEYVTDYAKYLLQYLEGFGYGGQA